MTDYGTIKIPRDDYQRHNERRKELGQSWAEYIDGQAPDSTADTDALVDDLVAQLPPRIAEELR